ncbi:MAG: hypothetical protein A3F68_09955 [Acidobacteria bacterium RIFCSPLOWO2_12_FULL_54_10]|nr:MAG: hypothetical protein A3F68_09955 [Acidobacteria bacterium RIFCSPLOWO2_12_FULL_54_10]
MEKVGVADVSAELLVWFERCGYIRRRDPQRRAREGQGYKKGYEVRFVFDSEDALRVVRRLLTAAEFRPGKPFRKHRRFVLPVYGRRVVEWFVKRLPKGRERTKLGFSPDGRRLIPRSPISPQRPARSRLPGSALPPTSRRKPRGGQPRTSKAARD